LTAFFSAHASGTWTKRCNSAFGAPQIGSRVAERRGHAPAPASNRTSSEI
jgi:hypothetical protein